MNPKEENFLRLLRETNKLSLQNIRLMEGTCKLGRLKKEQLPSLADQTVSFNFSVNEKRTVVVAVAEFRLVSSYEDMPSIDPAIMVSAKFALRYSITKQISDENLKGCLENISSVCAWPYWREFVQSSTIRMGLPAFPIPLLSPARLLENQPSEQKPKSEKKSKNRTLPTTAKK